MVASGCRTRALEHQAPGAAVGGLSSCSSGALEYRLSSCGTCGLSGPTDVESSETMVPNCLLHRQGHSSHCTTREVLAFSL